MTRWHGTDRCKFAATSYLLFSNGIHRDHIIDVLISCFREKHIHKKIVVINVLEAYPKYTISIRPLKSYSERWECRRFTDELDVNPMSISMKAGIRRFFQANLCPGFGLRGWRRGSIQYWRNAYTQRCIHWTQLVRDFLKYFPRLQPCLNMFVIALRMRDAGLRYALMSGLLWDDIRASVSSCEIFAYHGSSS